MVSFGANLQANAMWMKSSSSPSSICPVDLLDCWKQFSLPVRQCPTHTCIMARTCLQASHVITLEWPSRFPDLTNRHRTLLGYSRLPAYPNWKTGWLNNGNTFYWDMYTVRLLLSRSNRLTECINKGGCHTRY